MKGPTMPLYRLTPPGELIRADSARQEGIHTVLRGITLVIGKPREVVLRRVPASVTVEVVTISSLLMTSAGCRSSETDSWSRPRHPRRSSIIGAQ